MPFLESNSCLSVNATLFRLPACLPTFLLATSIPRASYNTILNSSNPHPLLFLHFLVYMSLLNTPQSNPLVSSHVVLLYTKIQHLPESILHPPTKTFTHSRTQEIPWDLISYLNDPERPNGSLWCSQKFIGVLYFPFRFLGQNLNVFVVCKLHGTPILSF